MREGDHPERYHGPERQPIASPLHCSREFSSNCGIMRPRRRLTLYGDRFVGSLICSVGLAEVSEPIAVSQSGVSDLPARTSSSFFGHDKVKRRGITIPVPFGVIGSH